MKKLMIATLGLSLLSGTVVFAQDTMSGTDTMKKKGKKGKKKGTDTMSSTATGK